jgi:hypothetical protein
VYKTCCLTDDGDYGLQRILRKDFDDLGGCILGHLINLAIREQTGETQQEQLTKKHRVPFCIELNSEPHKMTNVSE